MQAKEEIRYFLGANSPQGFYSLYDHLIDPAQAQAIYILKGGPGCGKSSLMRRVAQRVEEAGAQVEYILCSGDPDSLDAIVIPDRKIAIVDGTSPHVIEPQFPGAVESYVNLGDCYDCKALHLIQPDIMKCMHGYKDCYARAYRCLEASESIAEDIRTMLITNDLNDRLLKRARGIAGRELRKKPSGTGQVNYRFLSAVTHRGRLCYHTTAEKLCKRVYAIEDRYGISYIMLDHLIAEATAAGHNMIVCPSPMNPARAEHLLFPDLSLAFLTVPPGLVSEKRPYRRIRIDAMLDRELILQNKTRLRFSRKVSASLIDEAVTSLAQAKSMHDDLEALYNPHVDFARVYHIAEDLVTQILA